MIVVVVLAHDAVFCVATAGAAVVWVGIVVGVVEVEVCTGVGGEGGFGVGGEGVVFVVVEAVRGGGVGVWEFAGLAVVGCGAEGKEGCCDEEEAGGWGFLAGWLASWLACKMNCSCGIGLTR